MKKLLILFLGFSCLVSCTTTSFDDVKIVDHNNDNLFPPGLAGQEKNVLNLPAKNNENNYRIEIVLGKFLNVDNCNQYSFFTGEISKKELKGYGYNYYVLNKFDDSKIISTMKYCPENKTNKFIPITNSILYFVYSSKLPIVIYTPIGVRVKYRIFKQEVENYLIKSSK